MAKKKAAKKTSSKKELMTMEQMEKQLAAMAEEEGSRVSVSAGSYLSVKKGKFMYQDADLGDELDVIILGFVYENQHFDTDYDADNPSTPGCFSLTLAKDGMLPHESSPNKQNEDCESCEKNEWGSGGGKRKACNNVRRLAMISLEDIGNDEAEVVMLKIAPSNIKDFDGYAKSVTKAVKRPLCGVVTTISLDEDVDYKKVDFHLSSQVDKVADMAWLLEKKEQAEEMLMEPYDPSGYAGEEDKSSKSKKGSKKKTSSKKKSSKSKKGKSKFSK